MAITTQMVKELRERTSAGILDCRNALQEADGDLDKAVTLLRERGLAQAAKKAHREASEGRVEAYIHAGAQLGTLIEVNCETDFVARTEEFQALCHELAMQVAAAGARWVSRDQVPAPVIAEERSIYEKAIEPGKPADIVERILEGKLAKFYQQHCLLEQPYIRDGEKTIQQLVTETIAAMGENIVVRRFARFQVE